MRSPISLISRTAPQSPFRVAPAGNFIRSPLFYDEDNAAITVFRQPHRACRIHRHFPHMRIQPGKRIFGELAGSRIKAAYLIGGKLTEPDSAPRIDNDIVRAGVGCRDSPLGDFSRVVGSSRNFADIVFREPYMILPVQVETSRTGMRSRGGSTDAFVTKLNATGSAPWSIPPTSAAVAWTEATASKWTPLVMLT